MTKILLVEDDKSLREIYGVRLLAEGYDIISAGDGEAALAMAIKDRPQLILSDVMMPKISGFDMLDILRSTTETKGIKVIMMTALSSEDQRQRGESLGADRYLVKSQVGIEDVVRTVHEVLGDAPGVTQAQPADPAEPGQTVQPTPQPVQPPAPTPQPTQTPAPEPDATASPTAQVPQVPTPEPATPAPQPAQADEMPQPTAPFSTPRPSGLGDRVIHPISSTQESDDNAFAQRLQDELADTPAPAEVAAPSEPAPEPEPSIPSMPSEPAPEQPNPAEPTPEPTQAPDEPASPLDFAIEPTPEAAASTEPVDGARQPISANIDPDLNAAPVAQPSEVDGQATDGDFVETPRPEDTTSDQPATEQQQ